MSHKPEQAFENRAELTELDAEKHVCDYCSEPLLFHMKDNEHEFSIGITTILTCLALAEQRGHVPELPEEWWIAISGRYTIPRQRIYEQG